VIVIAGLIVLLVAVIVAITGVLANAGPAHPLTGNFAVLGYHVTGSTGTLFVFGIVIGALAMLGLSVLLAGARRTAGRGRDARIELRHSQRESAFLNRDRDLLLEEEGEERFFRGTAQVRHGASHLQDQVRRGGHAARLYFRSAWQRDATTTRCSASGGTHRTPR